MAGFTEKQKRLIIDRDSMCLPCGGRCGTPEEQLTVHHRMNRGHGGSKLANTIPNGLACCWQANGRMESDADFAELARGYGWKVARNGRARPEDVPVWVPWLSAWVLLTLVGDYMEVPAPTHAPKLDE
jgi:hypothetical protein